MHISAKGRGWLYSITNVPKKQPFPERIYRLDKYFSDILPEPEEKPAESDGKARITELETMVNSIARELSEIMGTAE